MITNHLILHSRENSDKKIVKEKVTINRESDKYRWFNIGNLPEKRIDKKEEILKWKKILEAQAWKMQ